jgi:hypothetical protein
MTKCTKRPFRQCIEAEWVAGIHNRHEQEKGTANPDSPVIVYYCGRCDFYHVGHKKSAQLQSMKGS